MAQPVILKGVRSGLCLKLDPDMQFEKLTPFIRDKFASSASFFGGSKVVLSVEGRVLSEKEADTVMDIITENTSLSVEALITESEELTGRYDKYLKKRREEDDENLRLLKELKRKNEELEKELESVRILKEKGCEVHVGSLRSGVILNSDFSILILGDVKNGAQVTAAGSIFVIGSLLGNAAAGCRGDNKAIVMATHFDPLQIRIAEYIAISEDRKSALDRDKGIFRKLKSKPVHGAEAAVVVDGHIVVRGFDRFFLEEYRWVK